VSLTKRYQGGQQGAELKKTLQKFVKLYVKIVGSLPKHSRASEHPYSADLTPSDLFMYPKINEMLKGKHFGDIDDIWSNRTAALKTIPQNQFENYFGRWTRR
jgi:hypothetical protein